MREKFIHIKAWLLLTFLTSATITFGQSTKQRAETAVGERRAHIALGIKGSWGNQANMNAENAIDTDESSFALVRGNAGLALGLGGLDERLILTHNTTVPAGTKYYVKTGLDGSNELLTALLGGSLGNTLGNVLGLVLLGNAEADFSLQNNGSTILSGDIYSSSFAGRSDMFIGLSGANEYYMVMNPNQDYNRFQLQVEVGGTLLGLGNNAQIDVYDAFYYDNFNRCDIPLLTSYTASGGLLSLINSAPVQNAHHAIDNDPSGTYSTIGITSLLNLNAAGSVEQLFHLPTKVDDQSARFVMQLPSGLLNLSVAEQSSIVFYDGNNEVTSVNLDNDLIDLDLLGLINADNALVSFAAAPKDIAGNIIPYDKIGIRIFKPLNVDLLNAEDIRVYDVAIVNDNPIREKVCTKEFINGNIREIKFNITNIIPNYDSNNTYVVRDANGANIDISLAANHWQPLGSYLISGITGHPDYCPDEDVNIMAVQDTQFRINGETSISMPLDGNDDGTADAQHTFNASDYFISDLGNLNADVTTDYSSIEIFDENTLQNVTGQTITFPQIGSYNYYVKTTNLNNPDCDLIRRVTVYVFDKADCEYRYEQLLADTEITSTVSLLGIPLGGTSDSAKAVDNDLSTHGSIFNVVSLLGIGTTSQKLLFTEGGSNKTIDAGTPLTVKIGQDYGVLEVIGGLTIQALDTNGNTVGNLINVGEIDLANVLVGDNVFEYTFVPKSTTGTAIDYSGVQVNLGSVLGLANTIRVYGAYIDERTAIVNATCQPNIEINGAETPNGLDENLLLNTSTKDVFWGTQDIGLGVATLLSTTLYGYQAADAINNTGDTAHGTPNYDTFAVFNSAVGALNQMSLTVKFKEIARPGDKVRMVIGRGDLQILDLNVLGSDLTAQRYMGDVAIGDPEVIDATDLIELDLLSLLNSGDGQGKYAYTLDAIGAPFDRIEIRLGNVVNADLLSAKLRVYDVSLLPYFAFESDDETTTLCTSAPFEIEKLDPCTSYELSYAYPEVDSNDNIIGWTDIPNSEIVLANENDDRVQYRLEMKEIFRVYNEAGTLYMKVQTTRQGCLYGDVQYLKVKIAACGSIVNPMVRTRLESN